MKSLSFAAILVTACAVAACSDDGDPGGDGGAGGGGGASGTTTSSSSSSTVTTGTGTGGSGEGGSGEGGGGEGGGADCATQCIEDNQQGAVAFLEMTLEACGCAESAACASDCDTAEAETDACEDDGSANLQGLIGNQACRDCVGGLQEDACIDTSAEQCAADEGCTAYITCVSECL
ncbi:hypothetical protein [Sorangium sp. So ce394]|uniref:hypothetical protein n=1 Tax=Sorangium sp. So ce394 TaxID=3133310 RepID=UPI003F5B23FF